MQFVKACMKSNWYIVAQFCIVSARKHFIWRTEAVGDQLFMMSLICMSPLTHILALSLSRPPYNSTGHSSGITTTTVAAVKDSTGNTRELYVLLDTGCSSVVV